MTEKTEDAIQAVAVGLGFAFVLSILAFVYKAAGWPALEAMAAPVLTAFGLGRITAVNKWMREQDRQVKKLLEKYK